MSKTLKGEDAIDLEANTNISRDEVGKELSLEKEKAQFSLKLIFEALEDEKIWMAKIITLIICWSTLSACWMSFLREASQKEHGSAAKIWLGHFDEANKALVVMGSLFSFSLVFRFKVCYDRWWVGRGKWLDIITTCFDLSIQSYRWMSNTDFADRMNRYLIVYAYACKAQLRGVSIGDKEGDSEALIERGHLTREELDDIHNFPSWQPHYCTEMMREIVQTAMLNKGSFYLEEVRMNPQLYRCFDNSFKKLIDLIGDCISLQASEMPIAYDGIHLFIFKLYFLAASVVWSASMSWLVIPFTLLVSFVMLLFIVLGTKLIDPFGTDKVDIPIHDFCHTVEAQLGAIKARARRGTMKKFALEATPISKQRENCALKRRESYKIGKLN